MHTEWDVNRYDHWYATDEGQFALHMEKRLLDVMCADWRKRSQGVLEIGCGTGIFLEILWHMGFDVTGVDRSQAMVGAALDRVDPHVSVQVANGERLPYDDGEFEFVFLWSVLEFCHDPEAVIAEARRVAAKGMLIGFLNRHSLYWLCKGAPWAKPSTLSRGKWFTRSEMTRMVAQVTGFNPILTRSVLPGPVCSWNISPLRHVNRFVLPGPLGAFCAMRFDFVNIKPLTPIAALRTTAT